MLVAIVAGALAGVAGPLAAQVPRDGQRAPAVEVDRPSALADIDRLAVRAVTLVRSHVPDRAGTTIRVLPFATDTGAATRLGHRLQSAVHLRLLREYRSATIQVEPRRPLATPTVDGPGVVPTSARPADHALEVEIQPFRETVRVILRVHGSGTVTAGDWVDLPVNDELQDLLDGTGAGGAGTKARGDAAVPAASTNADANAGADSEPERTRTPLPSVVAVDQGQQRYTIGGEDWVTLQVPAPGFYLLEGRSISGPLTLSAHYDRAGPPVVAAREDLPSVGNGVTGGLPQSVDRVLGIFSGPQKIHARVATSSDDEVAFLPAPAADESVTALRRRDRVRGAARARYRISNATGVPLRYLSGSCRSGFRSSRTTGAGRTAHALGGASLGTAPGFGRAGYRSIRARRRRLSH